MGRRARAHARGLAPGSALAGRQGDGGLAGDDPIPLLRLRPDLEVDGVDVVARDQTGSSVKLTFTRVGDTIYGRIVGSPAPTVLVLERESQ